VKELQHLARLVDLAEDQHGALITVAQTADGGVPPRRPLTT